MKTFNYDVGLAIGLGIVAGLLFLAGLTIGACYSASELEHTKKSSYLKGQLISDMAKFYALKECPTKQRECILKKEDEILQSGNTNFWR